MNIYLAGPDVFLPDGKAVGALKVKACALAGYQGHYPLDNEFDLEAHGSAEVGQQIYDLNMKLIQQADIVMANLSPFRGISADPGTVFEIGVAAGLNKPIIGYSNCTTNYAQRTITNFGTHPYRKGFDGDDLFIDDFGNVENPMIDGACRLTHPIICSEGKDLQAMMAFHAALLFIKQNETDLSVHTD